MYALVDCNNFYASCERVFRPDLNGKPIVVLSNNDGCIIARSNEAKAVGIPMGAPAFEQKAVFAKHNVQVFSANFALYGDMSHRVFSILQEYAPQSEIYSIDEIFLRFDGLKLLSLHTYGLEMRRKVLKWTGIPVSVGIAATKSLAKVANRIAKKFPVETGGSYVIDNEEKRIKALKWLAVEDVWGIGRQHAKRLKTLGVRSAFDFTQLSDAWVRGHMSVVGLRLKQDLCGSPVIELEAVQAKKTIATTRTFERNYTSKSDIKERVVSFAVVCAEKLRKQNSCCNSLMLFLTTNWNRKDLPQYSRNTVVKLPFASNSSIELARFAEQALDKIFAGGYAYKKAGVIVMDLVSQQQVQQTLFDNSNPKHRSLMEVIDKLNAKHGQQKVRLGAQDQNRLWKMKQEKLSPRYTTNIHEIITINASCASTPDS